MSAGTSVFAWARDESKWTEVFDAAPHGLGTISRLAVSPKADAVAIVVTEPKKQPALQLQGLSAPKKLLAAR
jgi:hypothetical protein